MKYSDGTVAVTNGSNAWTGTGTLWLANAAAGDLITVTGSGVLYDIGSVDANGTIHTTAPYAGLPGAGLTYTIVKSFTTNFSFPYPDIGDVQTATILKRALTMLDGVLNTLGLDYSLQTPATGFAITAPSVTSLILKPAGTLATGAITLPASPKDGQKITISSTQTITALTASANAGQSIIGAATTLSANASVSYRYIASITTWVRV